MDFRKTPAITLKRINYKDSSQIITFYTRDFGKVQTLAKGVKRSVKGVSGGIDLLTHNDIVFIHREESGLHILTEWIMKDNFFLLRENLRKFYSAFYVLELIREFTEENDKNGPLYDLFINTLYEIGRNNGPANNVSAFQIKMLSLLGFMPEMNCCVTCKAEINSKGPVFFSALDGGLNCTNCGKTAKVRFKISRGAISTINYLANMTMEKIERLIIQPFIKGEVEKLLRYYISFLLNKELKMWRYI